MRSNGLYLVSACLLGLRTRYDGASKAVPWLERKAKHLVPVCPEQLGGLPTPRPPAEIVGGDGLAVLEGQARVINAQGEDVTSAFVRGAEEVLRLAKLLKPTGIILKARSPSCGLSPKIGVCAALLRLYGFSLLEVD